MDQVPVVDVGKCAGTEECINICPEAVFELRDGKATVVNPDDCVGDVCGSWGGNSKCGKNVAKDF